MNSVAEAFELVGEMENFNCKFFEICRNERFSVRYTDGRVVNDTNSRRRFARRAM